MSRSLIACITGNFFLRTASVGSGALVTVSLSSLDREAFTVPATFISLVAVAFFASELLGAPIFGSFSDKYGPKPFMILGSIFGGVAIIVLGIAVSLGALAGGLVAAALFVLPVRVFEGLSTAANVPSTLGYLSRETAHDQGLRGRVLSWYEIATIMGVAAGPVAATALFDLARPVSFGAMAVVYLFSLALFFSIRDTGAGKAEDHSLRMMFSVAKSRRLMRFVPGWLAINAVLGLWLTQGLFLLTRSDNPEQLLDGGFSATAAGVVFAGFGIIFALGVVAWGFSFGRLATTTIMLFALGGLYVQIGVLAIVNAQSAAAMPAIIALVAVAALGSGVGAGFTPAALAYLSEVAEERGQNRGVIMGLYSVFFALGQGLGAALGGLAIDLAGANGFLILTLILIVIATVTVVMLRRWSNAQVAGTPVAEGAE